jgi:molybdate transport system regulatory protein
MRSRIAMASPTKNQAQVHVRIVFPNGGSLNESDIVLIETIQRCRSILGTSKLMGLSYRKTWLMADALNRTFQYKVIETFPGRRGAGAEVTVFGERVVALFRSVERRTAAAAMAPASELTACLDLSFEARGAASEGEARQG